MTKRKRCIIVGLTVLAAAAAALAVMLTRNRPAFIVKHVIYEAMDANSTVNSRWWAYDINALELLQGGYNKERDFFDGMSKEYGEKITSWKGYYKVSKKSLVQDVGGNLRAVLCCGENNGGKGYIRKNNDEQRRRSRTD